MDGEWSVWGLLLVGSKPEIHLGSCSVPEAREEGGHLSLAFIYTPTLPFPQTPGLGPQKADSGSQEYFGDKRWGVTGLRSHSRMEAKLGVKWGHPGTQPDALPLSLSGFNSGKDPGPEFG